jgi:hypothetical protein
MTAKLGGSREIRSQQELNMIHQSLVITWKWIYCRHHHMQLQHRNCYEICFTLCVSLYFDTNQLTPWRQNPKVHRRIHNSPPPVPILNQVNLRQTPPTNLPKVHFATNLPYTPWSSKRFLPCGFPTKTLYTLLPSPMRATCPDHLILLDFICLIKSGYKNKL